MFDFLRKPKGPRPIFEALSTDMHCHLVPRVDDGSKSMEETLECLKIMQSVGYRRVFITPHFQFPRFPNDEDDIRQRFEEVRQAAAEHNLEIELAGVGGEYRMDSGFRDHTMQTRFLTIGESNALDKGYLLVEFSLHQRTFGAEEMIADLQQKGYIVVLAHPERYPYLNVNGVDISRLKEMGVLLQLNVLSLDGFYGEDPMRKAYQLLDRGWAEMLGTDTHNTLYAQALVHASNNKRIEKILEKTNFMNIDI